MKIFNYIFYLFVLASLTLYSCEKEAPETINPSLVEAEGFINEYVALQSSAYDALNIVGDVLLRTQKEIQAASTTAQNLTFDDCEAQISIVKTSNDLVQISIDYGEANCPDAITNKTRGGKIIVQQTGTTTYYSSGHQMSVTFDNFQLNSQALSGTIAVKNTSKSSDFTLEDTVKQQLTYTNFQLNANGMLGSGYQERGLIKGLQSRSIGDDMYWSDTTHLTIVEQASNTNKYTIVDPEIGKDPLIFDMFCWNNQVYYPTKGIINISFESASVSKVATVDFGNGACERFKTVTVE
ncbi:hypothetical protein [Microscilla marina]|uniref:Lipoprotein, putative n=1 Tax=Microscilla marina ATCC 23134 TaxID=313606 RepID=A1ZDD9_MICM2|nr:hypothetical protein [Microscilla marina]EAY31678.1 lipoprotein, putative [Microscilla marina ATCC 23134]